MNKSNSRSKNVNYLVAVSILVFITIVAKFLLATNSRDIEDKKRKCDSLISLGFVKIETDLKGALENFDSAKNNAYTANYRKGKAVSASYLGYIHERLGNYQLAYDYLRESEMAFVDKQPLGNKTDSNGLSLVYTHYSILFKDAKNDSFAINYAKKALSIDRNLTDKNSALRNEKMISDYFNLGELYRLRSKFEQARNELDSAKALIKEQNTDTSYLNSIYKLNFAQIILDEEQCNSSIINPIIICTKRDSAKKYFEEVIINFSKVFKDDEGLSEAYLGLANCYVGMKNYDTALTNALKSKELGESMNCTECVYKSNLTLSKIYSIKSDPNNLNKVNSQIISYLDSSIKRVSGLNLSIERLNKDNENHEKEHQVKTNIFFYALLFSVVLGVLFILINSLIPKPKKGNKFIEIVVLSPIWLSLLFLYEYIILLAETSILHDIHNSVLKFNIQVLFGLILVICHSQATEGVQHYIKKKYGGAQEMSTDHAIKSFVKFTLFMLIILIAIYFLSPYFHH